MNTKNLLIALAVVIAIGAVAAVALTSGGDDEPEILDPTYDNTMGELQVYGNANNDLVIDDKDVKYIQDAIKNKVARTPFCDANNDGDIDDKDVQHVRDMIADKDGTKVWYVNGLDKVTSVEWPLNKIVIVEHVSSMHSVHAMSIALELDPSRVLAYNNDDPLLYAPYKDCNVLKTFNIDDYDEVTRYGVPDAILTGIRFSDPDTVFDIYGKMKVDLIPTAGVNGDAAPSAALTVGYVLGCADKSMEIYDFYKGLEADFEKNLAKIPDDKRKNGFVWFGGHAVAGKGYAQEAPLIMAGGINLADWTEWKKLNASEYTWFLKYDPDFVFRIFPVGYDKDQQYANDLYNKYGDIISVMDVYKEGHYILIDSGLPPMVKAAYIAQCMYPEYFGEDFGDKWHQQLVDLYNFDYKCEGQAVTTLDEAKA